MHSTFKQRLKYMWCALNLLRLWPHVVVLACSRPARRKLVWADVQRWADVRHASLPRDPSRWINCLRLLCWVPEFRNLFYYRLGWPGRALQPLAAALPTLYIHTKDIGPGLYIQHGFATIISAAKLGSNCWINQGVTLGFSNDSDCPTLGDGVVVGAGAKVIGAVTVGDRAVIGANAVVVKDIPADATAVGVPARVARLRGVPVPTPR